MTDVVFVFEVHQPHRLKRNLFWENKVYARLQKKDLFSYYFDSAVDKEIFQRAARKCYFPSNQILLDVIDAHKKERKQVKVSFSVSGVFLEQQRPLGNLQATRENGMCRVSEPNILPLHQQSLP